MEVKKGYKQTELGQIPIDWHFKRFQDVMSGFSSGQTPSRSRPDYFKGQIRWITSGELNYNIITDTLEKITDEAVEKTHLKVIPKGTFLIAITGLEAAGTRGSCGIVGEDATTNQSCMALYPSNELLTEYLFHFYIGYGDQLALKYCQGTKQQSYTGKIARILPIVLPPTTKEQSAIVEVLSEVNNLITNLEKLITKKESIKKGTMQILLSGKKRLPGFTKKWKTKRIRDFTNVESGGTPSTLVSAYWDGNIRWMNSGELNLKKVHDVENRITELGIKNSSTKLLPPKCVLIGLAGQGKTRGTVALNFVELCTNQSIAAILPNNSFCPEFLYYNLDARYDELRLLSAGDGGRGGLNLTIIKNLVVQLPEKDEQIAIAQSIGDMDKELEKLISKLNKYRNLKQGLMKNLLTGKIRLV